MHLPSSLPSSGHLQGAQICHGYYCYYLCGYTDSDSDEGFGDESDDDDDGGGGEEEEEIGCCYSDCTALCRSSCCSNGGAHGERGLLPWWGQGCDVMEQMQRFSDRMRMNQ